MPVYDFGQPNNNQVPDGVIPPEPPGQPILDQRNEFYEDPINKSSDDVRSILHTGFSTMDEGIYRFFNENLTIQTRDSLKAVSVRLAGGDKTILIWKQDLESGRITLPVMSINRTTITRDETRFSPAYVPIYRRFTNKSGNKMMQQCREWPANIEYQLSIWAESKRDLETILFQILTRFNPLAEWVVSDPHLKGRVQAILSNTTINTDIEASADKQPFQRADVGVTVWGWLPPANYKITPTVLGRIGTISEATGVILEGLSPNPSNNLL